MILIGPAKVSDFLQIAALDRIVWAKNRNSEFIPDGEHAWRLWVEYSLVFVAKDGDQVVGAILAFPCKTGQWCIHKVFVDPPYRKRGVGCRLFAELLKELDLLRVDCFLTVDPKNQAALRLYEQWGFRERKFVAGYYRPAEDRYVLTRCCC